MKKLLVCLLSLAILISMAGCSANAPQTQPTETKPLAEYEFLTPPEGWVNLGLADGRVPLTAGGYTWTQTTGHGTGETMHADQYMQPLPVESMQSISFQAVPIDGVTMSLDGFSAEKGSVVTLDWQTTPDAISGICWPTEYETETQPQLLVDCNTDRFTAYVGSFIYELTASWLDDGAGGSGKSTYYIHVTVEEIGVVPIA